MGRKKSIEQDFCKILYVEQRKTVAEILERVEVSERTLRKWINNPEENWDKLRKSLLITKNAQIILLYDQLEWMNNEIAKRSMKVALPKEADVIIKLTAAIKRLEVETSIGETIEVGKQFLDFVKDVDFEKAKEITPLFDQFIKSQLGR